MRIPNLLRHLASLLVLLAAAAVPSAQTYSYDDAGRIRQVTYDDGTTIAYEYDTAGNPTTQAVTPEPPAASSSGGCFIATAAYGTALDPHVQDLRDFRDAYLLPNAPGRWIISVYERTSPPLAAIIERHPALRFVARVLLAPVVLAAGHPRAALALGLLAVFVWMRRRRSPGTAAVQV